MALTIRHVRALISLALLRKYKSTTFRRSQHTVARVDFTGITGVNKIYQHLKYNDGQVAARLLEGPLNYQRRSPFQRRTVTDVGGADGEFMRILQQLLAVPINCHIIEPSTVDNRLERYQKRASQSKGMLNIGSIIQEKVEEPTCKLTKSDFIILSHSLYYNLSNWFLHRNLQSHLFTKFFKALNSDGILCVILQSNKLANLSGTKGALFNHEKLEDHVYPLVEKMPHSHNLYYANSQQFELALDHYHKMLIPYIRQLIPWTIQSDTAVTSVPLGAVNIIPNEYGKYPQTEEVNEIFTFYLKGRNFDSLIAEQQKYFIDLLVHHFQTRDGQFEIIHVNSVYTIAIHSDLQAMLEELDDQFSPKPRCGLG